MPLLTALFRLIAILLLLAGVPAFYLLYQNSGSLPLSLGLTAVYEVVVLIATFLSKVWGHLEGKWAERLADRLDETLQGWVSGYRKTYLEHIIYQHRVFDVKGLSTQGPYNLELEKVFVQLSVDPTPVHTAGSSLIQALPEDLRQGTHTIWEYLQVKEAAARHMAILGAPGSGKTTLLKHMALTLAAPTRQRRKAGAPDFLPVLLFLRDHAAAIKASNQISLPEVIREHLKSRQIPLPPDGWLEKQMEDGRCLIMLDGLDEVADAPTRQQVVAWVECCIAAYGKNRFIVTSRPHGYRSNPLDRVNVLQVRPFTLQQVRQFVQNWYLANEMMSSQRDDPGVRGEAQRGAEDLLQRLRATPTLSELSVNPLLLTMIATVHRYRSSLPGRRVELYAEICEVFLGKRQAARGLSDELTPAQKIRVLRELAYHLMLKEQRQVSQEAACQVIAAPLDKVSPGLKAVDFLRLVENGSGLLVERENGEYSFSHLTFQEYLAARHVIESHKEEALLRLVGNTWWHETIRLYCANADASAVIDACLEANTVSALSLAIDCIAEAREVSSEVRQRYEQFIQRGAEDLDPERRRLVAQAMLAARLK